MIFIFKDLSVVNEGAAITEGTSLRLVLAELLLPDEADFSFKRVQKVTLDK